MTKHNIKKRVSVYCFFTPGCCTAQIRFSAAKVLSQHQVSSSRTAKPRTSSGARCTGHVSGKYYAVCSVALHP